MRLRSASGGSAAWKWAVALWLFGAAALWIERGHSARVVERDTTARWIRAGAPHWVRGIPAPDGVVAWEHRDWRGGVVGAAGTSPPANAMHVVVDLRDAQGRSEQAHVWAVPPESGVRGFGGWSMWAPLSLFVLAGAWISRQIARARIHLLRQLTQYLRTRRAEDRPQVQGRDAWSRALRELTAEADLSVHDLRWQPAEVEVDAVVAANDAPAQSKVA